MKDYYKILGVEKTATEAEIKKAFRALSVKYHPDKNPGNKEAEAKYKEVTEAYHVLSDDEKRQNYDNGGMKQFNFAEGFDPFSHFGGFGNINDIFQEFFRQKVAEQKIKGSDINVNVFLSLEEVLSGCSKHIEINRQECCLICSGSGAKQETDAIKACSHCAGSGRVIRSNGFMKMVTSCGQCNGSGKIIVKICSNCNGNGIVFKKEKNSIKIPAGVAHGNVLRIQGKGNTAPDKNSLPGDLFISIAVQQHQTFERSGDDIFLTHKIPFPFAVLGGKVSIPILQSNPNEEAAIEINLPDASTFNSIIEIENKGLPNINTKKRGKQIVKFVVDIPSPKDLSDRQKELLTQLQETFSLNNTK